MESAEIAKRLQAIIETAIDGIITIDDQGVMESVNRTAGEIFGYAPEELIGKKVNMLMNDHDRSRHDEYMHTYHKTGHAKIIGIGREVVGKKKDGNTFHFRLAVSEVVLSDRTIYTGVIHDVSDIKKAEKRIIQLNEELEEMVESRTLELESVVNKLLRTNQELEAREKDLAEALKQEQELNELKSRFISMASHEFRTPLSTILSSASLISKYTTEEQQPKRSKHIDKIKTAVGHLTTILNDFLSLSKLEEGQVKVNYNTVELCTLLEDIIEGLKGLLKPGQKISLAETPIGSWKSDQKLITHIMFNLLSNAIKYSGENSTITVRARIDPKQVCLEVEDEGIGIPYEDQKFLFTRFFRANNVENIQGTGLGLHITQNYVELLNGQIKFNSHPGEGTTFLVKFPNHE